MIQIYVFWDLHEPEEGVFHFPRDGSSADLVGFLRQCEKAGLYVNLRFGPYVCAEWNVRPDMLNNYMPQSPHSACLMVHGVLMCYVSCVTCHGLCGHVQYGGFPVWLRNKPGVVFRTMNDIFLDKMSAKLRVLVCT